MANAKADKLKALKLTLDKLDKTYGKGTVMKMEINIFRNIQEEKRKLLLKKLKRQNKQEQ